jgi:hypothetical protein
VTAGFWSSFDIVNPDSHIFFHRTFFISFFIYFFNTCVQLLLASQCTATRIRHMISTAFARSTQKAGVLIYHSHCFKKKISIASSATVLWHAIEHRDVSTKVKRPAVARPLKLARVGSNIIWIWTGQLGPTNNWIMLMHCYSQRQYVACWEGIDSRNKCDMYSQIVTAPTTSSVGGEKLVLASS